MFNCKGLHGPVTKASANYTSNVFQHYFMKHGELFGITNGSARSWGKATRVRLRFSELKSMDRLPADRLPTRQNTVVDLFAKATTAAGGAVSAAAAPARPSFMASDVPLASALEGVDLPEAPRIRPDRTYDYKAQYRYVRACLANSAASSNRSFASVAEDFSIACAFTALAPGLLRLPAVQRHKIVSSTTVRKDVLEQARLSKKLLRAELDSDLAHGSAVTVTTDLWSDKCYRGEFLLRLASCLFVLVTLCAMCATLCDDNGRFTRCDGPLARDEGHWAIF
jgi:hypothetical protein